MGPGDCGRSREGMPRGRRGVEVGLWPRAPRPALRFPGPDEGVDVRERVGAASRRLEDLRRRLARAFQRAVPRGRSRRPREAVAAETPSGARGESALDQLRAELLEMHSQNRQLAKTLLDLNMKMQQLKKEYELEIASESQSSEDNAVNLE
ncbi:alanine- and arginine-rich domain-containing protein [Pteropus medius]|uniref:alanine and arginine-rich domain-containing protein n=1 Tax=Pteropus vampyrus TaxID=132908 RepID=UPI00196B9387|nr:alanine and arginine-rich domain-containing protein [Pteropus giganteus]